uniref:DUF4326 domain-containing protein n=1 Tax=viral metagenome TaxID=1070528 RepID=A0A6C0BCS7_9ZZZZ
MSCVCDVHKKFLSECGYNDLKHWCSDPSNEYVGRKGILIIEGKRYPEQNSIWANPYKVGKDGDLNNVLNKYYSHLCKELTEKPYLYEELKKLKGKRLGCWCVSKPYTTDLNPTVCHAQILMVFINWFYP